MSKHLYIVILFFILLFVQVMLLNNILFLGFINPYLYIAFVFLFPFKKNKFLFLSLSFLIGLTIDFFMDSGGANAAATLFLAYISPTITKLVLKKNTDFNIDKETFGFVFQYVSILTIIHHFLLFSLLNFSFQNMSLVITNAFSSSVFTIFLYFLTTRLFRIKTG